MIECRILSVDEAATCIEAAFLVDGSWLLNRIFHPKDPEKKPIDLSDPDQVRAYVEQYAMANYAAPASVKVEDGRFFVEEAAVRKELEAIHEKLAEHANVINGVAPSFEEQEAAIQGLTDRMMDLEAVVKSQWEVAEARQAGSLDQLRADLTRIVAVVEAALYQRVDQVEQDVKGAWWRKLAWWVKANSSLLGGRHG